LKTRKKGRKKDECSPKRLNFHQKSNLGVEFTAHEGESMTERALTSFPLFSAYRSFAANAQFLDVTN